MLQWLVIIREWIADYKLTSAGLLWEDEGLLNPPLIIIWTTNQFNRIWSIRKGIMIQSKYIIDAHDIWTLKKKRNSTTKRDNSNFHILEWHHYKLLIYFEGLFMKEIITTMSKYLIKLEQCLIDFKQKTKNLS